MDLVAYLSTVIACALAVVGMRMVVNVLGRRIEDVHHRFYDLQRTTRSSRPSPTSASG